MYWDCTGIGFEVEDEDAEKSLFFTCRFGVNRLTKGVNGLTRRKLATGFHVGTG